jgi:hypothetical protein
MANFVSRLALMLSILYLSLYLLKIGLLSINIVFAALYSALKGQQREMVF